jgi:hypothetical protein
MPLRRTHHRNIPPYAFPSQIFFSRYVGSRVGKSGEQWLFQGPVMYYKRLEVAVIAALKLSNPQYGQPSSKDNEMAMEAALSRKYHSWHTNGRCRLTKWWF